MGLLDDIKENLGFDNEQEKADKAKEKAKDATEDAQKAQAEADKAAGKTTPASNPTSAPKAETAGRTHTVVSGDTLSEIGAKYGVSWKKIAEVNNIENPDLIFPGQVFKIPS